jgi:hypothetical protein
MGRLCVLRKRIPDREENANVGNSGRFVQLNKW